jgi:hypothetical protein
MLGSPVMAHPITSTPPASHLSTPSHGELKSNDERDPTRTPSPTPSEQAVLSRDRRLRLADLLKPKILSMYRSRPVAHAAN